MNQNLTLNQKCYLIINFYLKYCFIYFNVFVNSYNPQPWSLVYNDLPPENLCNS